MNRPKDSYSEMEQRFCENVASGHTPTESAKMAGYAYAQSQITALLNKPRLMKLIVYLLQSRANALKNRVASQDVKWHGLLRQAKKVIDKILDDYIKKNKLQGQVEILKPRLNINEYMVAADLFVFASSNEGFGSVFSEASSVGLPILTTYLPGLKEFINNDLQIQLLNVLIPVLTAASYLLIYSVYQSQVTMGVLEGSLQSYLSPHLMDKIKNDINSVYKEELK